MKGYKANIFDSNATPKYMKARSITYIKHITSVLYHPSTNGLAERAVQIVKRGLKKEKEGSMKRLAKVMMAYHVLPRVQQVNHQLYYFKSVRFVQNWICSSQVGMNVWNIVSKSRRLNMMHRLDRLHSHKEKLCMLITSTMDQDGYLVSLKKFQVLSHIW